MKRTILILSLLALAGCSVIMPSDAIIIDGHAANANEVDLRVQASPDVPTWLKSWHSSNGQAWEWTSDWAHGRAKTPASPTTQPSE